MNADSAHNVVLRVMTMCSVVTNYQAICSRDPEDNNPKPNISGMRGVYLTGTQKWQTYGENILKITEFMNTIFSAGAIQKICDFNEGYGSDSIFCFQQLYPWNSARI
jgi:hypothetical protein